VFGLEPDGASTEPFENHLELILRARVGSRLRRRRKPPAEVVRIVDKMSGPMVMFWDDDLLSDLTTRVRDRFPTVDIEVVDGGQAHYPLLLGVE